MSKPIKQGVALATATGLIGATANSDLSVVTEPGLEFLDPNGQEMTIAFSGTMPTTLEIGYIDASGTFIAVEAIASLPASVVATGQPKGGWIINVAGGGSVNVAGLGAGLRQGR